jgi:hypothetical protein
MPRPSRKLGPIPQIERREWAKRLAPGQLWLINTLGAVGWEALWPSPTPLRVLGMGKQAGVGPDTVLVQPLIPLPVVEADLESFCCHWTTFERGWQVS